MDQYVDRSHILRASSTVYLCMQKLMSSEYAGHSLWGGQGQLGVQHQSYSVKIGLLFRARSLFGFVDSVSVRPLLPSMVILQFYSWQLLSLSLHCLCACKAADVRCSETASSNMPARR